MDVKSLLAGYRVITLDIETTGLNLEFDRIIELGVVEHVDGELVVEYSKLFGGGSSPFIAASIHGISDASRKGLDTFEKCGGKIASYLSNAVLVGHNINRFDIPMIKAKLRGKGLELTDIKVIDTYVLARRQGYPGKKLVELCKRFDIEHGNHRGLGDSWSTWYLLLKLIEEIQPVNLEELMSK